MTWVESKSLALWNPLCMNPTIAFFRRRIGLAPLLLSDLRANSVGANRVVGQIGHAQNHNHGQDDALSGFQRLEQAEKQRAGDKDDQNAEAKKSHGPECSLPARFRYLKGVTDDCPNHWPGVERCSPFRPNPYVMAGPELLGLSPNHGVRQGFKMLTLLDEFVDLRLWRWLLTRYPPASERTRVQSASFWALLVAVGVVIWFWS